MKLSKKNIIILVLILVNILLTLAIFFVVSRNIDNQSLSGDTNASEWNGNQYIQKPTSDNAAAIAIPGWDYIYLKSDTLNQQVNFYNPKANSCLFVMSLYIEDKLVWKSGYVEPGYGYYNIGLTEIPFAGTYDGYLKIQCFERNGQTLNSAKINFIVYIQEETND